MKKKKVIIVIILILLVIAGYVGYRFFAKKSNDDVRHYLTAPVKRGSLVVSVSGSGQVTALEEADIKSKIKGDITVLNLEKGKEIKKGQLVAVLDTADYQKAINEAETSLETAKLELDELLSPADELTILEAENAIAQAKNDLETLQLNQEKEHKKALKTIEEAEENVSRAYEDTLTTITDVFWDLPTIVTAIKNVLYSEEIGKSETTLSDYSLNVDIYQNFFAPEDRYKLNPFLESAENSYTKAKENYDKVFEDYKKIGYFSEKKEIEDLLTKTIETTKLVGQAIKDEINLLSFVNDYLSDQKRSVYKKITDYQSDLKTYTSKINNYYSNLLSIQRTLEDSIQAKLDAQDNLAEMEKSNPLDLEAAKINIQNKEKKLADLKAGPDELDIRAKQTSIHQKEDALLSAKEDLANCYIYSPFDGIVSEVKVKKGDNISAGGSLATLITKQKIVEITLNEIDVANVKVGQKAIITFDALSDLTFNGEVIEIDTVGTVSQGVVTYNVKISFDSDDERIKPGMSVSAVIITEERQNVLMVSNSAIKYQKGTPYVEVLSDDGTITLRQIELGISNDTYTEVVSGLNEKDKIVLSINNSNQSPASSASTNRNFTPPAGDFMRMMR